MNEHFEKTTYFFTGVLNIDLACFRLQESNVHDNWCLKRAGAGESGVTTTPSQITRVLFGFFLRPPYYLRAEHRLALRVTGKGDSPRKTISVII